MVEQVEFKDFKIGELFDVAPVNKVKSKNYLKDDEVISQDGKNNYIAAISVNNGVKGLSTFPANNKGKVITVSTTADSSNTLFYQEDDFVGRQQISGLRLKEKELNRSIGLYFVSIIRKHLVNFNYGSKLTNTTLQNLKIPLPVTSSGSIDYSCMESYISYIEKAHILKIEKLLQELGYNSLKDAQLTQEDKEILRLFSGGGLTLAEFKIGELFDTSLWKYSLQSQNFLSTSQVKTSTHDLAVVTGTVVNNSIAYYVNRSEVNESNIYSETLTMTTRGQSGVVRFQEEEFLLHNNSLALCGVFEKLNKNKKVTLYLMAALNKLGYGNSYSNFPTVKSLSKNKIPLPINPQSPTIPNYSLMESYITAIEKLHVNKLISSNTKEIAALNTVSKVSTASNENKVSAVNITFA